MDCGYAVSNCMSNVPDGPLPMTGVEMIALVGFALALVTLGLLLRYPRA